MAVQPRVATLEAFIIDTFSRMEANGHEVPMNKLDQLGGAGTYGIIGSRIFLPPQRLAMIVDYTPETLSREMRDTLEAFGSDMLAFRKRTDGNGTTRAVNRYHGEKRGFEYLSPPRLLTPRDLLDVPTFSNPLPSWLHLVSYPERAEQSLSEISSMSAELGTGRSWTPGILWEPEPPCCLPENLNVIARIARQVDVVSPNHTEGLALFGFDVPTETMQLVPLLEWLTRRLVALRPRLAAVVRAGAYGCCYALTSEIPSGSVYNVHSTAPPCVDVHWIPPFWQPGVAGYEGAVVDPTGAGNAFMGGLMAGLDAGKDMREAVIWANVAASFVIEQDGLPRMVNMAGVEVWNGDYPHDRVEALRQRSESRRLG